MPWDVPSTRVSRSSRATAPQGSVSRPQSCCPRQCGPAGPRRVEERGKLGWRGSLLPPSCIVKSGSVRDVSPWLLMLKATWHQFQFLTEQSLTDNQRIHNHWAQKVMYASENAKTLQESTVKRHSIFNFLYWFSQLFYLYFEICLVHSA